jgi:hypothetical protein
VPAVSTALALDTTTPAVGTATLAVATTTLAVASTTPEAVATAQSAMLDLEASREATTIQWPAEPPSTLLKEAAPICFPGDLLEWVLRCGRCNQGVDTEDRLTPGHLRAEDLARITVSRCLPETTGKSVNL